MTYYRILTNEELEALKPEFIRYLASQGIPADTWQQWMQTNPDKRTQVIVEFSEFIFFSILDKTRFLIREFSGGVQYVRIGENGFEMLWFKRDTNSAGESTEGTIEKSTDEPAIEVYSGKKSFTNPLKAEIYSLLSEGYRPLKSHEVTNVTDLFETYKDIF